jgi:hypothetical protein
MEFDWSPFLIAIEGNFNIVRECACVCVCFEETSRRLLSKSCSLVAQFHVCFFFSLRCFFSFQILYLALTTLASIWNRKENAASTKQLIGVAVLATSFLPTLVSYLRHAHVDQWLVLIIELVVVISISLLAQMMNQQSATSSSSSTVPRKL